MYFLGRKTAVAELGARLAPYARAGASVNIKADSRTGLGAVVSVVDEVKAAGFGSFNIITE